MSFFTSLTALSRFHSRRNGMTLMEMMIVVTIMVILLNFTTPLFNSISESSNLTSAGQILSDQIKLAAQMASSRNQITEVRLIKINQSFGNAAYRAVQLWAAESSGTMRALDKMVQFPQGIVISERSDLSPLLTLSGIVNGTISGGGATGQPYVAFHVRPAGYFEPSPAPADKSHLYLTLLNSRNGTSPSAPANYVTIQISPYTCGTTLYRP